MLKKEITLQKEGTEKRGRALGLLAARVSRTKGGRALGLLLVLVSARV